MCASYLLFFNVRICVNADYFLPLLKNTTYAPENSTKVTVYNYYVSDSTWLQRHQPLKVSLSRCFSLPKIAKVRADLCKCAVFLTTEVLCCFEISKLQLSIFYSSCCTGVSFRKAILRSICKIDSVFWLRHGSA